MTALVPTHPEAVPDAPDTLRWVIPAATLPFVGGPSRVPAPLAELVAAAVLAPTVVVEPTAVVLRIAEGRSWRHDGPTVRRALQQALAQPGEWEPPADAGADDRLRAAAADVLAGEVGEYVAGHGGAIEIVEVRDGRVTIALRGTCAGCPASAFTVRSRIEAAVRRRCPELREIVAQERPAERSGLLRLTRPLS